MKKKRTLSFISLKDKKVSRIVAIVLIVTLALFGINRFLAYQDGRRFAEISNDKDAVVSALVGYLGDSVESVESKDICFSTEQGPYNNGRLWCQVSSVVHLRGDIDFKQLGEQLVSMARNHGFETSTSNNYNVPRYSFTARREVSCGLGLLNTDKNYGSAGTSDALFGVSPPAFSVACADRAKAKHYHYVD